MVTNGEEPQLAEGGNNRSFVYLSDKESGVRQNRESGVELSR